MTDPSTHPTNSLPGESKPCGDDTMDSITTWFDVTKPVRGAVVGQSAGSVKVVELRCVSGDNQVRLNALHATDEDVEHYQWPMLGRCSGCGIVYISGGFRFS